MLIDSLFTFLYGRNMFWLLSFFSLGLGILLGFFFGKIQRLLFVGSTFLIVFVVGGYLGNRFLGIKINLEEFLSRWYDLSLLPWPALLLQLLVAVLVSLFVALRQNFYPLGRFFAAVFLSLQLLNLLTWLGRWVDVLRALQGVSLEFFLEGTLGLGILSFAWKRIVVLVSSFLGSAFFMVTYLSFLEREGWLGLFWGSTPFLAFLFIGLAMVMFGAEERA